MSRLEVKSHLETVQFEKGMDKLSSLLKRLVRIGMVTNNSLVRLQTAIESNGTAAGIMAQKERQAAKATENLRKKKERLHKELVKGSRQYKKSAAGATKLNQAGKKLNDTSKTGARRAKNWWNSFGRVAIGFTIAYRAMNLLENGLRALALQLKGTYEEIDEFNKSIIEAAASIINLSGETAKNAKKGVESLITPLTRLAIQMDIVAASAMVSGEELRTVWATFAKRGVVGHTEEDLYNLARIAETIKSVAQKGQGGKSVPLYQFIQETISLFDGAVGRGREVIYVLQAIHPEVKKYLKTLREANVELGKSHPMLKALGNDFKGMAGAQDLIYGLLVTQTSQLDTYWKAAKRLGGKDAYAGLVIQLAKINEGMKGSDGKLTGVVNVAQSWYYLMTLVELALSNAVDFMTDLVKEGSGLKEALRGVAIWALTIKTIIETIAKKSGGGLKLAGQAILYTYGEVMSMLSESARKKAEEYEKRTGKKAHLKEWVEWDTGKYLSNTMLQAAGKTEEGLISFEDSWNKYLSKVMVIIEKFDKKVAGFGEGGEEALRKYVNDVNEKRKALNKLMEEGADLERAIKEKKRAEEKIKLLQRQSEVYDNYIRKIAEGADINKEEIDAVLNLGKAKGKYLFLSDKVIKSMATATEYNKYVTKAVEATGKAYDNLDKVLGRLRRAFGKTGEGLLRITRLTDQVIIDTKRLTEAEKLLKKTRSDTVGYEQANAAGADLMLTEEKLGNVLENIANIDSLLVFLDVLAKSSREGAKEAAVLAKEFREAKRAMLDLPGIASKMALQEITVIRNTLKANIESLQISNDFWLGAKLAAQEFYEYIPTVAERAHEGIKNVLTTLHTGFSDFYYDMTIEGGNFLENFKKLLTAFLQSIARAITNSMADMTMTLAKTFLMNFAGGLIPGASTATAGLSSGQTANLDNIGSGMTFNPQMVRAVPKGMSSIGTDWNITPTVPRGFNSTKGISSLSGSGGNDQPFEVTIVNTIDTQQVVARGISQNKNLIFNPILDDANRRGIVKRAFGGKR